MRGTSSLTFVFLLIEFFDEFVFAVGGAARPSLGGLAAGAIAGVIGWVAGLAGLQTAMWLLLLGPLCLAVCVPRVVADQG